ncbi:hypothetical protein [Actinomadura bangladeshensis]|uniref:Uncharacterized protein n=1 Tax=Actinomadura bangladeshensis TaxID=453573 RepID=A0A6L9QDV1_9ACTN|nr:hypothetical protein [Actinomadura bangladeshensis]NEA23609.1 hypothetical protein [Actinomadura bangladeshensis]
MVQSGMRITVDAAMRARDVSRPRPEGGEPPAAAPGPGRTAEPARRTKAAKNARRRQGKRGAAARRTSENGL